MYITAWLTQTARTMYVTGPGGEYPEGFLQMFGTWRLAGRIHEGVFKSAPVTLQAVSPNNTASNPGRPWLRKPQGSQRWPANHSDLPLFKSPLCETESIIQQQILINHWGLGVLGVLRCHNFGHSLGRHLRKTRLLPSSPACCIWRFCMSSVLHVYNKMGWI